jgi:transglycosylase-like protein
MRALLAIVSRSLVLIGVIAVAMLAPGIASPAQMSAKVLSDAHVGTSKPELKAQIAFSGYVTHHFEKPQFHWRLLPRHSTCWSHVASQTLREVCNRARSKFLAHRWLYSVAEQRYEKLYAPKSVSPSIELPASLVGDLTCIHSHEGAWNANTGNGYYGGLQMDSGFMSTYGPEFLRAYGTADKWPISAQLEAAARAYNSGRGFGPWPNTARMCGLL